MNRHTGIKMLKLQKCFSLSGFISFDPPSTENKTQISLLTSFSVYSQTPQSSMKADGIIMFLKLPQYDFFFPPSAGNETEVCTATRIKIFYLQF